jgi:hypothetical protein
VLGSLAPEADHLREVLDRVPARGVDELLLAAGERARVDVVRGREQSAGRQRDLPGLESRTRRWHLLQRPPDTDLIPRRTPRHPMLDREPRRRRQMSVALEEAAPVDLREPAETFDLEQLEGALQFGELLLDPRIRQVGQGLGAERLHDRSKLAHEPLLGIRSPATHGMRSFGASRASVSNMRSNLPKRTTLGL